MYGSEKRFVKIKINTRKVETAEKTSTIPVTAAKIKPTQIISIILSS